MSHESSHEVAEHGATFTAEQIAVLHASDREGARNFVSLMVAIFLMGVVLYLCVAYVCSQGP